MRFTPRKWLTFLSFSLLPLFLAAQHSSFPNDWAGKWHGELKVFTGDSLRQSVEMTLTIAPADSGRWQWTLQYGNDDLRPYYLMVVDAQKGYYQIDEGNSIVLDAQLNGQVLSSRFSVNNTLLLVTYRLEKEDLLFEVFFGALDETSPTGQELTEEGPILNYHLGGRQIARLRRS